MAKAVMTVDSFLDNLDHPLKTGIITLRKTILAVDSDITEQIKWNAPSFCIGGDDRITFRFPPKGKAEVQLIFHRGAKSKDSAAFEFTDSSGLVQWAASDRGVVTLTSPEDIAKKTNKLAALAKAWFEATDPRK